MDLKQLVLAGVIGVGVLGAGKIGCSNYTYSNGSRTGYVNKFSEKGVVFKTHEGDLTMTLGANQNGIGVNTWSFSVKDNTIAQRVEQAMEDGRKVKLTYEQTMTTVPWKGDTTYFVTGVEYIGEDKK